jgi:hypothetical protein
MRAVGGIAACQSGGTIKRGFTPGWWILHSVQDDSKDWIEDES